MVSFLEKGKLSKLTQDDVENHQRSWVAFYTFLKWQQSQQLYSWLLLNIQEGAQECNRSSQRRGKEKPPKGTGPTNPVRLAEAQCWNQARTTGERKVRGPSFSELRV